MEPHPARRTSEEAVGPTILGMAPKMANPQGDVVPQPEDGMNCQGAESEARAIRACAPQEGVPDALDDRSGGEALPGFQFETVPVKGVAEPKAE